MPIEKNEESVKVKYEMPAHIKALATDDFLKEFRNQLFRIHKYYSLDTFADEGPSVNTSTFGWYAAFYKTCRLTEKEELLDYRNSLKWYDADTFDGEITDMLIERKFLLGDVADIIAEKLGIPKEDIIVCADCQRYFSRDMVVEITDDDEDPLFSSYRCLYCNDVRETRDTNKNVTNYYRDIIEEAEKYRREKDKEKDIPLPPF